MVLSHHQDYGILSLHVCVDSIEMLVFLLLLRQVLIDNEHEEPG